MLIRPLSLTDVTKLVELEKRSFTGYYSVHQFDETDFVRYLSHPRVIAFGAYHAESCIGYILGLVRGGQVSHVAKIYSVAVDWDWRRRGVGTQLMNKFISGATDRGCTIISLEVTTLNTAALRLVKKLGFKIVRNLPQYYGEGVDGKRMRLAL